MSGKYTYLFSFNFGNNEIKILKNLEAMTLLNG